MTQKTIKTHLNDAGNRRVVFRENIETGTIRYDVDHYFDPAPEDEGIEIGWIHQSTSGLFSTLAEAEKDASSSIDWLRSQV